MVALPGRGPELKPTSLLFVAFSKVAVVLIPRPTHVLSFLGGIKMEVLCPVGNKSAPKTPNPYKILHPFCILRGWMSLHLVFNHFFRSKSPHVDITSSMYWVHSADMEKENRDRSPDIAGCAAGLGEALESSMWPLPGEGISIL